VLGFILTLHLLDWPPGLCRALLLLFRPLDLLASTLLLLTLPLVLLGLGRLLLLLLLLTPGTLLFFGPRRSGRSPVGRGLLRTPRLFPVRGFRLLSLLWLPRGPWPGFPPLGPLLGLLPLGAGLLLLLPLGPWLLLLPLGPGSLFLLRAPRLLLTLIMLRIGGRHGFEEQRQNTHIDKAESFHGDYLPHGEPVCPALGARGRITCRNPSMSAFRASC
jgi:hypothetical protein